eukprot:713886_1
MSPRLDVRSTGLGFSAGYAFPESVKPLKQGSGGTKCFEGFDFSKMPPSRKLRDPFFARPSRFGKESDLAGRAISCHTFESQMPRGIYIPGVVMTDNRLADNRLGPGSYDVKPPVDKKRFRSFDNYISRKKYDTDSDAMGPGHYDVGESSPRRINGFTYRNRRTKPRVRTAASQLTVTPGPGQYRVGDLGDRTSHSGGYSFPVSARFHIATRAEAVKRLSGQEKKMKTDIIKSNIDNSFQRTPDSITNRVRQRNKIRDERRVVGLKRKERKIEAKRRSIHDAFVMSGMFHPKDLKFYSKQRESLLIQKWLTALVHASRAKKLSIRLDQRHSFIYRFQTIALAARRIQRFWRWWCQEELPRLHALRDVLIRNLFTIQINMRIRRKRRYGTLLAHFLCHSEELKDIKRFGNPISGIISNFRNTVFRLQKMATHVITVLESQLFTLMMHWNATEPKLAPIIAESNPSPTMTVTELGLHLGGVFAKVAPATHDSVHPWEKHTSIDDHSASGSEMSSGTKTPRRQRRSKRSHHVHTPRPRTPRASAAAASVESAPIARGMRGFLSVAHFPAPPASARGGRRTPTPCTMRTPTPQPSKKDLYLFDNSVACKRVEKRLRANKFVASKSKKK